MARLARVLWVTLGITFRLDRFAGRRRDCFRKEMKVIAVGNSIVNANSEIIAISSANMTPPLAMAFEQSRTRVGIPAVLMNDSPL